MKRITVTWSIRGIATRSFEYDGDDADTMTLDEAAHLSLNDEGDDDALVEWDFDTPTGIEVEEMEGPTVPMGPEDYEALQAYAKGSGVSVEDALRHLIDTIKPSGGA